MRAVTLAGGNVRKPVNPGRVWTALTFPAQVIVADGTPERGTALERVLTVDPGLGVIRHLEAGYPRAMHTAEERRIAIP